MTDWIDLDRELDAWGKTGMIATLWWRDDDAVTTTPALHRLLELAETAGAASLPLALAVIPALADDGLPRSLSAARGAVAVQHGYAHANQAAEGAKKTEYPAGRARPEAWSELRSGLHRLQALFGPQAIPVLVPPWNRIDPELCDGLADIGMRGLSTFGPRNAATVGSGVAVINTHIDVMNWKGQRGFLGTERCLDLAIGHLAARRVGRVDATEATGLLTHHLVHDEPTWSFLREFLQRTNGHPAARWLDARPLFGCGPDAPA